MEDDIQTLPTQEVSPVYDNSSSYENQYQQEAIEKAKASQATQQPQQVLPQKSTNQSHPAQQAHRSRGIKTLLRYGQHSNFWKEVESLERSDDPVGQTLGFMDKENYGAIEGVGKIKLELLGENHEYWSDYFDTTGIGFDINTLAGGEVYNRISPKVRGYLVWDASFFGNLRRREVPRGKSGWNWLVGSLFGMGRQKIVEGEAIDFLVETPIKESTLFYLGADLELGYVSQFNDNIRFAYKGMILPTLFYSEFDDPKYAYGVQKGVTTLRWRTEFEQTYSFQPPTEGGGEIGAQLIGGQQPTPVRVLPRVWDSIHKIEFFPDYSTLIGIGAVARLYSSGRNFGFNAYGGYYGGYLGGGASMNVYGVSLEAGSFGFEQTSQFKLRESRVLYASLGFNHAW